MRTRRLAVRAASSDEQRQAITGVQMTAEFEAGFSTLAWQHLDAVGREGATHPNDIVVVEKLPERSADLARRHHVRVIGLEDGVAEADTVIIAVKPQGFDEALIAMRPHLRTGAVVISIAAGKTLATMERLLPEAHCIRCMPNTPALVGEGMTAFSKGTHATDDDLGAARAILATVGKTVIIPEALQDAMTSMHGSGPAGYDYVREACIDGGGARGRRGCDASGRCRPDPRRGAADLRSHRHVDQ